ncbi:chromosomal replication initiator protein DnaA [Hydrogenobaculum acidophilum]
MNKNLSQFKKIVAPKKVVISLLKLKDYEDTNQAKELWQDILESLSKKIDKPTMALLKSLKPKGIKDKTILLECPTEQSKTWISKSLGRILKDEASKRGISIKLSVHQEAQQEPTEHAHQQQNQDVLDKNTTAQNKKVLLKEGISSRYTFDNFIVGKRNEVAYKASLDVATNTSSIYNPLFIYGKVGSGKTHLLQAIGNKAYSFGRSVIYISMNDFTEEMVYYLKAGNIIAFREKYKHVDILLIDDIQFLSGKERTQIELFNIFNYLFQYNKHIVFASDKHPRDIKDISERLISRFEGGLLVETSIDEQIKLSIIKQKIQLYGLNIDDRLISYIKDNTTTNAREIEGLVLQIKAKGGSILEAIDEQGKDLPQKPLKNIDIDFIKKVVASYFNLSLDVFNKSHKNKKYATAKHIAIFLSREFTDLSLMDIARAFNIKSHSSVSHSIKKIEQAIKEDKTVQYSVSSLREIVKTKAKAI